MHMHHGIQVSFSLPFCYVCSVDQALDRWSVFGSGACFCRAVSPSQNEFKLNVSLCSLGCLGLALKTRQASNLSCSVGLPLSDMIVGMPHHAQTQSGF